ncbi:FxDxF family PEP-CTERM protein [Massilia horti]|nr:FxDxF family PEP-CTERM protein [Massilia horti]
MASASFASSGAMAQTTIGNSPQALKLIDNTAFFGDTFAANNQGNVFADKFTFSIGAGMNQNLDAIVSSISRDRSTGLDISGMALFGATDNLISRGVSQHSGAADVWTLRSDNLAAGDYYILVRGTMVGNAGASFGGAVALAPVPEPETYGMMLGGLGILGFLARRRKKQSQ